MIYLVNNLYANTTEFQHEQSSAWSSGGKVKTEFMIRKKKNIQVGILPLQLQLVADAKGRGEGVTIERDLSFSSFCYSSNFMFQLFFLGLLWYKQ